MKKSLLFLLLILCSISYSQVGINTITPNPNSILDLASDNKGLLLPRVALSSTDLASPLSQHVEGMTVYNTASAGTSPNEVTPGTYYNDGAKWVKIGSQQVIQGPQGDAGTNGVDGKNTLIKTTAEAAGANCATGGTKIEAGLDSNNNGVLDSGEINATITKYVCNGATGSTGTSGTNGVDGKNTLIKTTAEVAGANCATGGTKIEAGLDTNNNGVLDVGEINATITKYVCNGATGTQDLRLVGTNNHITMDAGVGNNGTSLGTGYANVGIGTQSFSNNTTGYSNTGVGYNVFNANTSGRDNVAIGNMALYQNTIGIDNTSIGSQALVFNTSGNFNSGVGFGALYTNTTGYDNSSFGAQSLIYNTTGYGNTALGYGTLFNNVSGYNNIGLGKFSMRNLTTGNDNIGIGYDTFISSTTGSKNTIIGSKTGYGITTGSSNTIIGSNVVGLASGLSNNIILSDGDGNVRINVISSGNVGIGTTTPTSKLHVVGLPIYASNAAAVTAGLTAGAFYHNGDGVVRVVY